MRTAAFLFALAVACDGALDPNAPAWRPIRADGIDPRWGQVAAYDARRDRMVVFGGDGTSSGQTNELLALDLGTLEWSKLPEGNAPGPRTDLAGVIDDLRDRFVIVGGRVGFASSIDEAWAYSFASSTWQRLPSGPPARHDVPGATDGTRMWVFGGAGEFLQSLDDLWELDFATDTWRELPDDGVRPSARTSGALVYWSGALYAVGGHDATSVQRDAWRYDLAAQRWTKLDASGAPLAWAHFGWTLDRDCGRVLLSGGDNLDNADVGYTDAFDLGAPAYALVPTSNVPTPRDHPSMILDRARRRLVLYGGGTLGDGLGTLGDAWMLDLGACR